MSTLTSGVRSESLLAGQPWMYGMDAPPALGGVALDQGMAEKRCCPRRPLRCTLQMIPLASDENPHPSDAILAECLNVSDDGLFATVPIGFGMARGQRYICRLRTRELGPDGPQLTVRQGVVVRSELLLSHDGDHQVGIAIRFSGGSGFLSTPVRA